MSKALEAEVSRIGVAPQAHEADAHRPTQQRTNPFHTFYARVACILLKGYLACADAGGNLLAARLLGHEKSDASIPINPVTILDLGQRIDIHAIPWTGIKKHTYTYI